LQLRIPDQLYHSFWTVTEFGFVLTNGSDPLVSTSAATNGGTVNLNVNTSENSTIIMEAYWVINSTYTNVSSYPRWIIINTGDTGFSILHFFDDLTLYIDSGIFGLDDFGVALITFLFIFVFVGVLSFKFGIQSPEAILGLIFGLVLFLDVGVGRIPNIGITYFPTIFTAIILAGIYLMGVKR